MPMRYVIMANGRGSRWNNYLGIPKHLIAIDGETLLERTARQVSSLDPDAEVIISSSDPRCEIAGIERHEPKHNEIELDRFVPELIVQDICFLYGDTYYTDRAMATIASAPADGLLFFGNRSSIVAVRSSDQKMLENHLGKVRSRFLAKAIADCKGWQLYQSYADAPVDSDGRVVIGHRFVVLSDETGDFNVPDDLVNFIDTRWQGRSDAGYSDEERRISSEERSTQGAAISEASFSTKPGEK